MFYRTPLVVAEGLGLYIMNKIRMLTIKVLILLFPVLVSVGCDYQETLNGTEVDITLSNGTNTIFKFTKRYFLLQPGDTALFYGTRVCTVITNGVISSLKDDSINFRTITLEDTVITVNSTPHIVYPQLYQAAKNMDSLSGYTITRFFELTDSGIFQTAYKPYSGMLFLEKEIQKVMPSPLEMGSFDFVSPQNSWRASPLIVSPYASCNGTVNFIGQRVATRYIKNETIDSYDYYDGVTIKTYYSFSGEISEDNEYIRLAGTMVITRNYFKDIGLVNDMRIFEEQRTFSDNSTQVIKEYIYFSRGPNGAKLYNDWEG